jgi:hypothetical protein
MRRSSPDVADVTPHLLQETVEPRPKSPEREPSSRPLKLRGEKVERQAEERRRQRSLINDVYRIHLPGTRQTYLQILLPLEEWVRVRLHVQLPIACNEDGIRVYRSFMSPKDPALGGRPGTIGWDGPRSSSALETDPSRWPTEWRAA